ncbi:hypothetical protein FQR65_LT18305 [Abscondita terminalis]|nr:hypothetical protein FQR65_LT18305 [Abscondita terminalis]
MIITRVIFFNISNFFPSSGSGSSRRDNSRKNSPAITRDDRRPEKRDDRDRSRDKDRLADKNRKDKRDSRDRLERERERERRIAREEREAAREKDREEALARCQERQRERERLKELAKKEEERRNRGGRRDDRGLDKPTGDRVERLLPLPADRIPPNRRGRSPEKKRPNNRIGLAMREEIEHQIVVEALFGSRLNDTTIWIEMLIESNMWKEIDRNGLMTALMIDRDYNTLPSRLRENDRRHEDKNYDAPYDRRHDDRRYLEMDERFNDNLREDRISMDAREYPDDRRTHREMWDVREERDVERDREIDQRRYGREEQRPHPIKGRDWEGVDYAEHEWDRGRRPMDWEGRGGWDNREHEQSQIEDEWRHYNRSMDSWTADDRRRWADWRERSRPRSTTSHQEEDANEAHRRELPKPEPPEIQQEVAEPKKEIVSAKRPAEPMIENVPEPKKPCPAEIPLEDNLSEISDDADEILNREEKRRCWRKTTTNVSEKEVREAPEAVSVPQKSPSPIKSPSRLPKEELIEDENMDLDFEEISEDELEEENRVKGLGDALGVDWASLVAESRPRTKPICSAKRRWESHNILVNIGISVEMAGEELVTNILEMHVREKSKEENEEKYKKEDQEEMKVKQEPLDVVISHPIAAIQVAIREKEAVRKSLFASAGPYRRALSARRDLAIRRHLCDLPINDTYVEPPRRHDPELHKLALQIFERSL